MWNRNKREDEMPLRPVTPPPVEPAREQTAAPSYPQRRTIEDAPTRAGAVIGKSLSITGRVTGREDLVVDGRVEGDIELPESRLTVGAGGHVQGGVRAREIVVYGAVQGNLEATERIEIKKNARVLGDLKAARPVIEDEAYFKGNVETIRVDPPKQPAAQPTQRVTTPPATGAATPSESQASLLSTQAETKRG